MPSSLESIDTELGVRIKAERESRGWSLTDLAQRSGVSRAMINRVERGESSPTASLIGRLSAAFGLTISTLMSRAEGRSTQSGRLVRVEDQPTWRDPSTGYLRRQVVPAPSSTLPVDVVQVQLPAGASVSYPASAFAFIRQVVWLFDGTLTFIEGERAHRLDAGDCLELGPPADCTFRNDGDRACTYAVVVIRS